MNKKTPVALVFITFIQSSKQVSAMVFGELSIPALLNAMSIARIFLHNRQ